MSNSKNKINGVHKISFAGRLDALGAKNLEHDLNECLHKGEYNILLGLEETKYISSAGIRILLIFRNKLTAIDGSFNVTVSDGGNVKKVLELSGLTMLIAKEKENISTSKEKNETFSVCNTDFEILNKNKKGGFSISFIGSSDKLISGAFDEKNIKLLSFPTGTIALGIGALGSRFENYNDQFGEFLAVGGVALTRPPGSSEIDYIMSQKEIIPEGYLLCGIKLDGEFDSVFRFSTQEKNDHISLSNLCNHALDISGSDEIVMVAVVEVANLVGMALTKSPAKKTADENIFHFPEVLDWLSFSGEPIYKGKTALVAGIASKENDRINGKTLKPLGDNIFGMFKTGVFSYNPLSREQIDLNVIIQNVFENNKLIDLMHLVNDQRIPLGVGESCFQCGSVWCGKIK